MPSWSSGSSNKREPPNPLTPGPPDPPPADRPRATGVPWRPLLAICLGIATLVILVRPVLVADPCDDPSASTEACVARRPDPNAAPVVLRGEVFVVGDSLTVGAEPFIEEELAARGWRVTEVEARVGRRAERGIEILEDDAGSLPPTVLIALGTNNLSATPEEVEKWLRDARRVVGNRRLIWVDLCLDDAVAPRLATFREINETLEEASGRYRVEVAHWCRFAETQGLTTSSDGIHYEAEAYRLRARFYAEALSSGIPVPAPRPYGDPFTGPR